MIPQEVSYNPASSLFRNYVYRLALASRSGSGSKDTATPSPFNRHICPFLFSLAAPGAVSAPGRSALVPPPPPSPGASPPFHRVPSEPEPAAGVDRWGYPVTLPLLFRLLVSFSLSPALAHGAHPHCAPSHTDKIVSWFDLFFSLLFLFLYFSY